VPDAADHAEVAPDVGAAALCVLAAVAQVGRPHGLRALESVGEAGREEGRLGVAAIQLGRVRARRGPLDGLTLDGLTLRVGLLLGITLLGVSLLRISLLLGISLLGVGLLLRRGLLHADQSFLRVLLGHF